MPCDSSHMEANGIEVELSKVACLLGELEGEPIDKRHWEGYHPEVYNKPLKRRTADKMVANLCAKLQKVDVTDYSLEMQMWWRDHQAADKARLERELKRQKTENERKAAIAKLSTHERAILGID